MNDARVLVVDDLKSAADTLAIFFQLEGFDVHTAYDGQQAVELASAESYDLILMDLAMPRLDGYEAARRIRELPGGHGPHLVALTGWSQEEMISKAREAGFANHLVKPVSPEILRTLLAELGLTPNQSPGEAAAP